MNSHYRFKFYINANHAIYLRGVLGQNHPHTWEITLDTLKVTDGFIQFDSIEKAVDNYLLQFQDKDLNTVPPFDVINPTLENLCGYLATEMDALLQKHGWLMTRMELSETPARSYIIDRSDETGERIPEIFGEQIAQETVHDIAAQKLDQLLGA